MNEERKNPTNEQRPQDNRGASGMNPDRGAQNSSGTSDQKPGENRNPQQN